MGPAQPKAASSADKCMIATNLGQLSSNTAQVPTAAAAAQVHGPLGDLTA